MMPQYPHPALTEKGDPEKGDPENADPIIPIETALISVSNRDGLEELLAVLIKRDVRLIATEGTAKFIQELEFPVTGISDYTDFPEIMSGRVKTLHPRVHGGILAQRDDPKHLAAMSNHEIVSIDLVVINLYPFEEVIHKKSSHAEAIENIDIGGPSMLRGAAKNNRWVSVLSSPSQYKDFIAHLDEHSGATTWKYRQRLAKECFVATAHYDAIIGSYLQTQTNNDATLPDTHIQVMRKKTDLSYGENPHQSAAVYVECHPETPNLCTIEPVHGKPLSYNNLLDAGVALRAVSAFHEPTAAVIKHNTPCGMASDKNCVSAFKRALSCDPLSAFGGVLAINCPLNAEMVEAWGDLFLEVVITPSVEGSVRSLFASRKNLRVLEVPLLKEYATQYRSVPGGILLQTPDTIKTPRAEMRVVSKTTPDEDCWQDLLFAWEVVRHVRSNGVVFARDKATVGIGTGQTSRLYSVQSAIRHAHEYEGIPGSVLASDAFFPFPDGLQAAIDAGIRAVIQPGGAVRDDAVTETANAHGIVMVHTGVRHFTH